MRKILLTLAAVALTLGLSTAPAAATVQLGHGGNGWCCRLAR